MYFLTRPCAMPQASIAPSVGASQTNVVGAHPPSLAMGRSYPVARCQLQGPVDGCRHLVVLKWYPTTRKQEVS